MIDRDRSAPMFIKIIGGTPPPDIPLSQGIRRVSFSQTGLEDALHSLFATKASFVLMPGVQGTITATIAETTLDRALDQILRLVGATYRIEGNLVFILPTGPRVDNLLLQNVDVRDSLRALFRTTKHHYSIAPEMQGRVTADVGGLSFDHAFAVLLRQVDSTYNTEAGVIQIRKREPPNKP